MGLFGSFKKKPAPEKTKPAPAEKVLRTAEYDFSKGFRGTRRMNLTTYKIPSAQEGINALKIPNPAHDISPEEPEFIFDFVGKRIAVKEVQDKNKYVFIKVFVDDLHIGNVFNYADDFRGELFEAMFSGNVDLVHLKIEPVTITGYDDKGVPVTEIRYTPQLFVKVAES